jgi:hypothetical protein
MGDFRAPRGGLLEKYALTVRPSHQGAVTLQAQSIGCAMNLDFVRVF